MPEWFVLDRNQNVGYASYVQDTDRVASLAEVFPIVFFYFDYNYQYLN